MSFQYFNESIDIVAMKHAVSTYENDLVTLSWSCVWFVFIISIEVLKIILKTKDLYSVVKYFQYKNNLEHTKCSQKL